MFLITKKYARTFSEEVLTFLVYNHNSLIRRKLGNVDMQLQENKAINLALATPKINGVLIKPGETFSFWKLVGHCNTNLSLKHRQNPVTSCYAFNRMWR